MPEVTFPESRCRFGVARRDVTPPTGIYHRMWGAAAHDRSEGVHRPLTATAMVLCPSHNDEQQILIAVDHCLLFDFEMQQLLDRVSSLAEIDREQLLVVFSHTHAAGLMEEHRAGLPGGELIVPYLQRLANEVTVAVREALDNRRPATITYTTGRCPLAGHRDFRDESSRQFVCGYNPDGDADDTVLTARVADESGDTIATLVNYACHPTTLAWDNRLISPDYPGAMREVVERETNAPCIFLQGASGDLGPRFGFVGDPDVADRNGRQLGFAALAALESLAPPSTVMRYAGPVISGATIGTWNFVPLTEEARSRQAMWQRECWSVGLPYRDGLPTLEQTNAELALRQTEERTARETGDTAKAAEARAMAERKTRQQTRVGCLPAGETFPYPVVMWRCGDAVWLAVEGEPYQHLQRSLRERFPETPIIVMALANGSRIGYLPTAATYGQGIYQESIALLAAGSLETLIQAIGDRLAEILPSR